MIAAMLLAAGESRRMGQFKQLLRLGDKTFVEHCVDNLLASQVGEVIVVTGHRESEVRRALGNRPISFVHNPGYRLGMSSSIKCGVTALTHQAQAFVISLVDQPHIEAAVVNHLIEKYEAARPLIVIPTYGGKSGHPILLDVRIKNEILAMDPNIGLRQVVAAHSDEITQVEVSTRAVLEDCDLPEDYERILNQ